MRKEELSVLTVKRSFKIEQQLKDPLKPQTRGVRGSLEKNGVKQPLTRS